MELLLTITELFATKYGVIAKILIFELKISPLDSNGDLPLSHRYMYARVNAICILKAYIILHASMKLVFNKIQNENLNYQN